MADVASYYVDLQLMARQRFDQWLILTNGYNGFIVFAQLELERKCVYVKSGLNERIYFIGMDLETLSSWKQFPITKLLVDLFY